MALPPNAVRWPDPMDPSDLIDYRADFRGPKPLLEPNERVANYTVTLTEEAVALGIIISQAPGYAPRLVNDLSACDLYFEVDPAERENPAFAGAGIEVGVVFTVWTDDNRERRRQRTWILGVAQQ